MLNKRSIVLLVLFMVVCISLFVYGANVDNNRSIDRYVEYVNNVNYQYETEESAGADYTSLDESEESISSISPEDYLQLNPDESLYSLSDEELTQYVIDGYNTGVIDFNIGAIIGYDNPCVVTIEPIGGVTEEGTRRELHFSVYLDNNLVEIDAVAYFTPEGAYYDCEKM